MRCECHRINVSVGGRYPGRHGGDTPESPRPLAGCEPRCAPRCAAVLTGSRTATARPLSVPPGCWVGRASRSPLAGVWPTVRSARGVPALATLATDHSGRAGALRTARARSGRLVSTPAGKRRGLRGVAAHPRRLLRWSLARAGSPRAARLCPL
jgi:hypothetical protein